jgi:hypothetical protein
MDWLRLSQNCPELFEEETIYSWLSRWVYDSPYPSIGGMLSHLLGTRNKQLDSTFPSFVKALSDVSGIDAKILINQHTIVPYFKHFCEPQLFEEVLNDIYNGNTQTTHSKMSITAGRINESKWLNYCPQCVDEDVKEYGIAYWHVNHQLPGVSACVKHNLKLKGVIKCRRATIKPPQKISEDEYIYANQESLELANISLVLLNDEAPKLDGEVISGLYRHKLLSMGLASSCLSIHQAELRQLLERYWRPIMDVEAIKSTFELEKSRSYPASLFYHPESHHHPLKHLLMIVMLFGSLDELYTFQLSISTKPKKTIEPSKFNMHKETKLALKALQNGESLRQASYFSGLSIVKVKQIAVINGIAIERREQRLFEKDRELILKKLKRYEPTQKIAKSMTCSVGAVEQILSQNPEVVEQRKTERFTRNSIYHRTKLIIAMRDIAHNTRGKIQKAARTHYTWLFRYDKAWLYRILPPKQPAKYWRNISKK